MMLKILFAILLVMPLALSVPKDHGESDYGADCYGVGDCAGAPTTPSNGGGGSGGGGRGIATRECFWDSQCAEGERCVNGYCAGGPAVPSPEPSRPVPEQPVFHGTPGVDDMITGNGELRTCSLCWLKWFFLGLILAALWRSRHAHQNDEGVTT